MQTITEAAYVWKIRPLTVTETVAIINGNWELFAALIDTAPSYPLPEADVRKCLFNAFAEYRGVAHSIVKTIGVPTKVIAGADARTIAAVAIEILAETRAAMSEHFFDALVFVNLRDCSSYLSGRRH